jgi:hypothetical protein
MSIRDRILAASDLRRVEVDCPEWGVSVFVQTMTGSQRDRWELAHQRDPERDIRARLAVFTVVDADGVPVFTEADVAALGGKCVAPLQRVFNAALELNAISKKDVEDLEGNSAAIPSGSSPSA